MTDVWLNMPRASWRKSGVYLLWPYEMKINGLMQDTLWLYDMHKYTVDCILSIKMFLDF